MTLPGENGQNLVEWRFRKEQTRGKVIVFGRKLRVSVPPVVCLRNCRRNQDQQRVCRSWFLLR